MAPFSQLQQHDPVLSSDSTFGKGMEHASEDTNISLHFISMVVVSGNKINTDSSKSGLFCMVDVDGISNKTATTTSLEDSSSPVWNHKMSFLAPQNPKQLKVRLMDLNSLGSADVGAGTMDFDAMFDPSSGGAFEGEVALKNDNNEELGTVTLKIFCRILKPLETEMALACKIQEEQAALKALDESERWRENLSQSLTKREEEVIQLADKGKAQESELAAKEKRLNEQTNQLMEANAALKEAESKLKAAEEEISKKRQALEQKEEDFKKAIAAKDIEIVVGDETIQALEDELKSKSDQVEALKTKVANEMMAKDEIIVKQSKELRELTAHKETVSHKNEEFAQLTKKLEEVEEAAKKSQQFYDDKKIKYDTEEQANELLRSEVGGLRMLLEEMHDTAQELSIESKAQEVSCWNDCLAGWS